MQKNNLLQQNENLKYEIQKLLDNQNQIKQKYNTEHLEYLLEQKNQEIQSLRREIEQLKIVHYQKEQQQEIKENSQLVSYLKQRNEQLEIENIEYLKEIQKKQSQQIESNIDFLNNKIKTQEQLIETLNFQVLKQNKQIEHLQFSLEDNKNELHKQKIVNSEQNNKLLSSTHDQNYAKLVQEKQKLVETYQDMMCKQKLIEDELQQKNLEVDKVKQILEMKTTEIQQLSIQIEEQKDKNQQEQLQQNHYQIKLKQEKNKYNQNLLLLQQKHMKQQQKMTQMFVMKILKNNHIFEKTKKQYQNSQNLILVNQKYEIEDGTFQVFQDFQQDFVNWIFKLFHTNSQKSYNKKNNSFMQFKQQVIDIKTKNNDYMSIMASFYFRLKNLIIDELPQIQIVRVQNKAEKQEAELQATMENNLKLFMNETNEMLKNQNRKGSKSVTKKQKDTFQEFKEKDNINVWLKNMLAEAIKDRQKSENQNDKIMYLFRLLAIKYRIEFPIQKTSAKKVSQDLRQVLDIKVCSALFDYFHDQNLIHKRNKNQQIIYYYTNQILNF